MSDDNSVSNALHVLGERLVYWTCYDSISQLLSLNKLPHGDN